MTRSLSLQCPFSNGLLFSGSSVSFSLGVFHVVVVLICYFFLKMFTPLKTNMSPKSQWLEDVFPTEIVPFSGTFVSFRGCSLLEFPLFPV